MYLHYININVLLCHVSQEIWTPLKWKALNTIRRYLGYDTCTFITPIAFTLNYCITSNVPLSTDFLF